jgi:EAL domain-containing protein (putative c-di-GMP-specific phosphodiesterase class I)
LTIVADGIEASDQEASVLRSGCDEGQGHHFSGSLLAVETERLFHTGISLPRYVAEGSLTG